MDSLEKLYLSKFIFAEHLGGCRNVLPGEEWSDSECVSEYDAFYYIKEGGCTFVIDGEKYVGIPGRLFLIPAGIPHSYHNDKSEVFSSYKVFFDIYPNIIGIFNLLGLPPYVDAKDDYRMCFFLQ